MRGTKVKSSAQNESQTRAMHETFTRGTSHGKEPQRWKETTVAIATADIDLIYTVGKKGVT